MLINCVVLIVALFGYLPLSVAGDGKELFAKPCASCHGPDGKAQTPIARKLGVKDVTQSKLTEAEIEKQIVDGKRDERGKEMRAILCFQGSRCPVRTRRANEMETWKRADFSFLIGNRKVVQ